VWGDLIIDLIPVETQSVWVDLGYVFVIGCILAELVIIAKSLDKLEVGKRRRHINYCRLRGWGSPRRRLSLSHLYNQSTHVNF